MATLIQRGKRGIWTAVWWEVDHTSPTGQRQRWKSTKLKIKKKAQEVADLWESAAQAKRVSAGFRIRTAELQRSLMGKEKVMSIEGYLAKWMTRTALDVKPVTLKWYQSKVNSFSRWLTGRRLLGMDIAQVQRDLLEEFLMEERSRLEVKTANDMRKWVQDVFSAAVKDGFVVVNPAEDLACFREVVKTELDREKQRESDIKLVREVRRPFTVEELQKLMSVAPPEWRSMIMFGLHTGQRLLDVASMRWRQVDLQMGEVVFKVTSKQGDHVRPAIGRAFMTWLLEQSMPDDLDAAIHPDSMDVIKRTGVTSTLSKQFTVLMIKAGLRAAPEKPGKGEVKVTKGRSAKRNSYDLSFHCLRHTHTTWLKQAGASDAVAMDNVGHDSEDTSANYTHIDLETRKKYADLLPDLAK